MHRLLPVLLIVAPVCAADWPQFRGPGGRAISVEDGPLPAAIDLEKDVVWRVPIAKGHSSPVIADGRVFVTAYDGETLATIALDEATGREVWRRNAPFERIEKVHRVGSPATPTVAYDAATKSVVSMFGSSGLHCHGADGAPRWSVPMGPFDNSFGASSSPVIADGRVLLVQDHDTGSFLACFDLRTGEENWRVERPEIRRGFSTPVVWRSGDDDVVVVASGGRVTAHHLANGEPAWRVLGLCRVVSNTPVLGADGRLYVASTGGGAAPNEPRFAELITGRDANANGELEKDELPGSPIKSYFEQFDSDKNRSLNEAEYESVRTVFAEATSQAMAIRPGGEGDITETHVDWRYTRSIPRNASPVLAGDTLFLARDGGILVSVDSRTGEPVHQARLPGSGKQYSSPVVGDGKLYLADDRGVLSIVAAKPEFEVLGSVKLGDPVFATPSIANGSLYVRTTTTLFRISPAAR